MPRKYPDPGIPPRAAAPDELAGGGPPAPNPGARMYMLRERPVNSLAGPLNIADYQEFQARRNLEQVGRILRRLEVDQAAIVQLRAETRAILAALAA